MSHTSPVRMIDQSALIQQAADRLEGSGPSRFGPARGSQSVGDSASFLSEIASNPMSVGDVDLLPAAGRLHNRQESIPFRDLASSWEQGQMRLPLAIHRIYAAVSLTESKVDAIQLVPAHPTEGVHA